MSNESRIMIGPIVGEYGGVAQHILHIIKYSKFDLTPIIPNPFSLYYSKNKIKKRAISVLNKLKLRNFDLVGLILNKVYFPHFKIIHLHGHPYWPEIFLKFYHSHLRYIHTVHQIYFEEDCYDEKEWSRKKYLNELMFNSCKESDVVISVAKWQQEILQKYGIDSIYIPNGIDIRECDSAKPFRFRQKYHFYDDFYLFPGDIRLVKRPDMFIALANMIPERKFIMIGKGINKENLSKFLRQDIPDNVVCLGLLTHSDVLDLFAASKVFILPGKNENFSISIIEAMGCKRTVVAANNTGPKEMITDGVDGFLFEPDHLGSLYERAVLAWDHPEIGDNAYLKVKNQYHWGIVVQQIDQLYSQLIYADDIKN